MRTEKQKSYYLKNKTKIRVKQIQYEQKNKEEIALRKKKYNLEHKADRQKRYLSKKQEISEQKKGYRLKHKKEIAKHMEQYYKNNKEIMAIQSKQYRLKHKEDIARQRRHATYGITSEQYDIIYTKQNGCCAICGKHETKLNRKLSVDHDHETGIIRGLLCYKCNTALGLFGDNIEILKQALNYLINT